MNDKRLLILADPLSVLSRERGLVGLAGGYEIYWYSSPSIELPGVSGAYGPWCRGMKPLAKVMSPLTLRRVIREVHPDLVHVHWALRPLDNMVLIGNHPLIVTVMGGDIMSDQSYRGLRKWPVRKLLDTADIITSKSEFMDTIICEIGDYADKIRRITWGVDLTLFRDGIDTESLRDRLGIGADEMIVLCPRAMQPLYNKQLVLEAFSILLHTYKQNAHLVVTEHNYFEPYRRSLYAFVRENNLEDRVTFVDTIPFNEMPVFLNLADVVVSMSKSDGMPQSLYEVIACGSFPILSRLPQYEELIQDGVNGILVELDDGAGLADAMKRALEDDALRSSAARMNRRIIRRIADKDKETEKVLALYEDLMKT